MDVWFLKIADSGWEGLEKVARRDIVTVGHKSLHIILSYPKQFAELGHFVLNDTDNNTSDNAYDKDNNKNYYNRNNTDSESKDNSNHN